mgnify:CR=1 FL=1
MKTILISGCSYCEIFSLINLQNYFKEKFKEIYQNTAQEFYEFAKKYNVAESSVMVDAKLGYVRSSKVLLIT